MSASSRTLQTFTQQETVTHCYLRTRLLSQSHRAFTNSYSIYCPIESLTKVLNFHLTKIDQLTLKMAAAQVVKLSVAFNRPSQDFSHPNGQFQSRYNFEYRMNSTEKALKRDEHAWNCQRSCCTERHCPVLELAMNAEVERRKAIEFRSLCKLRISIESVHSLDTDANI